MRKYFGTDGIRDVANTKLSPELAYRVAKAGAYVLAKHTDHVPTILIGRDTRISGTLLESAMTAGFLSYGANVKLVGVIPTPGLAFLTRKLNADASVMISASHNSYEYNGIKFFSNKGMKLSDELEEEIEQIMESEELKNCIAVNEKIGFSEEITEYKQKYVDFFEQIFNEDFKKINNKSFRVAIDTANGATFEVAENVFKKLGIQYDIINNNPNGININEKCGSTHLEELKDYVIKNKMSLGIAYDGDGDRCLAIDNNGNVIDGDKLLAIISNNLIKQGKLSKNTIVATVMSNLGFNKYLERENIKFVQTNVGDRYVLEEMLKSGYNLGGEQSGHIIFLDYNPTGDGILTSLMLIKSILENNKEASELNDIFKAFPQVLVNAHVDNDKKYNYNNNPKIVKAIEDVKNEFKDNGRVLIRTSGTEPLVRVMLEGENKQIIEKKAIELANFIEENLK